MRGVVRRCEMTFPDPQDSTQEITKNKYVVSLHDYAVEGFSNRRDVAVVVIDTDDEPGLPQRDFEVKLDPTDHEFLREPSNIDCRSVFTMTRLQFDHSEMLGHLDDSVMASVDYALTFGLQMRDSGDET